MNEQEEFEAWWDQDIDTTGNPYSNMSMMYWAWEAWKAGRKAEQKNLMFEKNIQNSDTKPTESSQPLGQEPLLEGWPLWSGLPQPKE